MGAERGPGDLSAGIPRAFVVVAGLAQLGRIDSEQPDALATDPESVAVRDSGYAGYRLMADPRGAGQQRLGELLPSPKAWSARPVERRSLRVLAHPSCCALPGGKGIV